MPTKKQDLSGTPARAPILIAYCYNCKGAARFKGQISRDLVLCPDCGHALFWERTTDGRPYRALMQPGKKPC